MGYNNKNAIVYILAIFGIASLSGILILSISSVLGSEEQLSKIASVVTIIAGVATVGAVIIAYKGLKTWANPIRLKSYIDLEFRLEELNTHVMRAYTKAGVLKLKIDTEDIKKADELLKQLEIQAKYLDTIEGGKTIFSELVKNVYGPCMDFIRRNTNHYVENIGSDHTVASQLTRSYEKYSKYSDILRKEVQSRKF